VDTSASLQTESEKPTTTDPSGAEKNSRAGRDGRGRFASGDSPDRWKRGRPPVTPETKAVRELAAVERPANVTRLVQIRDHAKDVWARIEAVKILLQYSDGKPVSAHQGAPLVNINQMFSSAEPVTVSSADASRVYAELLSLPDIPQINFVTPPPQKPAERRTVEPMPIATEAEIVPRAPSLEPAPAVPRDPPPAPEPHVHRADAESSCDGCKDAALRGLRVYMQT